LDFQILDELNSPAKVVGKFLKTWRDRKSTRLQCIDTAPAASSVEGRDLAGVALTVSKRLIAVQKIKSVLNIEAGLEMMALAMTICSEVWIFEKYSRHADFFNLQKNKGVFPESSMGLNEVLKR
jgi:hypothetical protein